MANHVIMQVADAVTLSAYSVPIGRLARLSQCSTLGLNLLIQCNTVVSLHPVCCLRFGSDWTQPSDILSADSESVCYNLSTKGCLGNPTLGTNLGQRILAMRTGCNDIYRTVISYIYIYIYI